MRISQYINRLILLLGIFCFAISTFAQGIVTGTIYDQTTGSTLPGATVMVVGMSYGASSDIYGKYILTKVKEGETKLRYSYLGYQSLDTTVVIGNGETKSIDISLKTESVLGMEVVVTGQMLGQTKAINQQLNSDAIANMVSEDKIKELPDANAAEAIGRISGVSLIRNQGEGQKVVIRGLEPRFSAITVNGIRVPSNDPEDKSVDLSMISPELLQGIEVYKSPTPDMDAESVGGAVNLLLNKANKVSVLKVNASGGYSALRNDFGNYAFSGAYNRRFFSEKFGIIAQANIERVNRGSDDIQYEYYLEQVNDVDTVSYRSVTQQETNEIRKRFGGSINFDFELKNGGINLYSLFSNTNRNVQKRSNYISYIDAEGNYNYEEWEGNSSLFSNMLSGKHTLGMVHTDWSISYAKTKNEKDTDFNMELNNRSPFNGQTLDGTHPNEWIEASSMGNDSLTYLYEMSSDKTDVSESNTTLALNFEIPFSFNDDWSFTAKVGGKYNYLNRIRNDDGSWERWYYFGLPGKVSSWDPDYPHTYYLDGANNNVAMLRTFAESNSEARDFVNGTTFYNPLSSEKVNNWHDYFANGFVDNRAVEINNTDITETIASAYVMGKLKYKSLITLILGGRYESSDNEYQSKISSLSGWDNQEGEISDTTTFQDYQEFFPHLHFKYEPLDWFSLRMSLAKTMARPNYNYVAYSAYINENSSTITAGNPDLKHMTSMNYDVNATFYTSEYGLLSVGAFYKDMRNIFYRVENMYLIDDESAEAQGWPDRKGYYLTSYENSPEAEVYGFELDLQTSLKFLPAPFNGVVLNANVTRLYSSTYKYTNELVMTDSVIGFSPKYGPEFYKYSKYTKREISIPGQVPLIVNLSLGYEYKGFSFRLSGNHQGEYLSSMGESNTGVTDRYREGFWRWDIALKQRFNDHFVGFFNANNVNNMKEVTTVGEYGLEGQVCETGSIFNLGIRLKY